jgi:predicted ATPase/class 3 adenylate cyclase
VTVLFCDVTGSTSLGEQQDPEQVRRVMSRYYDEARAVLERHGGTVEKFMGDAVMAVFGIPVLHEDDALRALRAAVEVQDAITELNVELERLFGVSIAVRIGVNSGEVVAGDTRRGDSFAAGDAVNVAQRLEAAAAAGEILIGDSTYRLARDAVRAEPLEPLAVKGKEELVRAHRLLAVLPGLLSHARRFDSPMVGRERELALLEDAFDRAVGERACHLFTVLGAAGVGKSRLLTEALRQIGSRATVVTGACLPYGEGITFWPALEVVKQATGITDDDTAERARAKIEDALAGEESAALAAERAAALVGIDEAGATAEEGFWGVRKLLEALARRRPLVVVFDDANWAEPTFLDLIEHVADWTRDAPILLVCMARPELLDLRPEWGGGKRNATAIFLEPLSETESEALLGNLLGGASVAGAVFARIYASAEGNPLFVEEMVSMLIDAGLLRRENGSWVADDLSQVSVPETIQILLASRLDQLGVNERQVLERAAVEGTVFHRGAIAALADDPARGAVGDCLMSLMRKELIRPHRASFAGEDAFRFRHVLIREAAYDALPKQVRAELHERFAAWLEEVAGERIAELEELLGYHLEQSYRYRVELARVDEHAQALALRAGGRLATAGRRALAKGDMLAAVNLLERAVSLLPEDARLEPQWELGVALREAGELAGAARVLGEALEAAARRGNKQVELATLIERAALLLLSDPGGTDRLLEDVEAAVPVLVELGDDRTLARAWTLIGLRLGLWKGQFARGEEALGRALEHAVRAGDRRQEAEILGQLGFSAWAGPTPVLEAISRCREMLDREPGDRLIEPAVCRYLAPLEARLGRFAEARDLAARARDLYEELGMRLFANAAGAMAYGDVELLAEDYVAAERALRGGLEALEGMGERGYSSSVAAFLARALYGQGRLDEAEEAALRALESASSDDIFSQALARGTRAKVLASRGAHAEAEQLAREAVALVEETDALDLRGGALLDLADVLALAGRSGDAAACAEEARQLFERKGNVVSAERARLLLERAGGPGITTAEGRAGPAS